MHMTDCTDLLSLFRHHKLGTLEIANVTGRTEAEAYNELSALREQEHELRRRRDYQREYKQEQRAKPASPLIGYAGRDD